MASEVEICNLALQKLGVARIASLTEDSRNGRSCNACYATMRDRELRAHPWNFARKRLVLAADSAAPAFDFKYAFTIPQDSLRVLPPSDNDLDWQIEGGKILTNNAAVSSTGAVSLNLVYVRQVTDPNQMDPLFRDSLACRLALHMSQELTQSDVRKQDVRDEYRLVISEAKLANAIEQVAGETPTDTWDTARL